MSEYVVEMHDIVKTFGHVTAVNNGQFTLKKGEIHSLIGENGAGKSTMMKLLYGMYPIDSGVIRVKGEEIPNLTPKTAIEHGIGMVHQEFMLVGELSVLENTILGFEPKKGLRIDFDTARKSVQKYIDEYNKSNGSGTISVTNVTTPDGSNNTGNNNNSSSSGNGPSTNGGSSSGASGSYGWKSDSNGWYYIYNGSVLKGSWLKDTDGKWYYMDNTGYMHTGWLHDSDNRWYYMNPNAGGPKGSMVTGLFTINGNLYYFSPVSGGPLGSMVTGNQTVNGVKYYFDPVTGVGTRQ